MIIVYRDNIPVACYDGVTHHEALRAFAEENLPCSNPAVYINSTDTAMLECQEEKYYAKMFTEDF